MAKKSSLYWELSNRLNDINAKCNNYGERINVSLTATFTLWNYLKSKHKVIYDEIANTKEPKQHIKHITKHM